MSETKPHQELSGLSPTTLEGMLSGDWKPGTEKDLTEVHKAVCLDGEVWKVIDEQENVLGFVRPTNCITSAEVKNAFREILL